MPHSLGLVEHFRKYADDMLKRTGVAAGALALDIGSNDGSLLRAFLHDLPTEYRMDCFEVNAVNYGVQQVRERVIFIANRQGRLARFPDVLDKSPHPDQPVRTPGISIPVPGRSAFKLIITG